MSNLFSGGFKFGFGNAVAKRAATIVESYGFSSGIPSLILPVNSNDVSSIFPYGVPTSDHPTGHPGIDFFSTAGAPVFASASGKVSSVIDSPIAENLEQKSIGIDHSSNYVTYYTGSLQNIQVSVGQAVKQGQKIAEVKKSQHTSFHWGLRQYKPLQELCPYPYVSAGDKTILEQLNANATFHSKSQYPLVCNECNPPGECR